MTAMQQIERISVKAREHGMTYGEYVEKYGNTLSKPNNRQDGMNAIRTCVRCGKDFEPKQTKDGSLSKIKTCPQCIEKQKVDRE